ncbi:MAG TPA: DUF983 domain-containing protein [Planctomycetota bacterium]|nr:DUF983 domain-containing protein [Planctomycetota bacterium]
MDDGVTFRVMLGRSLRLRCPKCGGDKVFIGLLRVKDRCGACGFNCRPEGGYYLGAIYINYGVTALSALAAGLPFALADRISLGIVVASAVAILVAISFFQVSRSLWLGLNSWARRP